jgi:hypothetical protein
VSTAEDRRNAALDDERIDRLMWEHERDEHDEPVPDCPHCEEQGDDEDA